MRPFLSNFITTLSGHRQARVGAILDDARVNKEQLDNIAVQLFSRFGAFTPMILTNENADSRNNSTSFLGNFQDVTVRLRDLFAMTNLVSLLLDSHQGTLSSDVKAIEDELISLEKLALNYAFLLGDGKAYDYAFLEPFNDEGGRDSLAFNMPDRAGQSFTNVETAVILPDQGVLVLPEQTRNHGISGTILKGNTTASMQEETPFRNLYTANSSSGWSASIHTGGPITYSLPEANGRKGAQLLLEFNLSQPAASSQIRLAPLADFGLEVLQVSVYPNDNDNTGTDILAQDEVRVLSQPITVHFPMQVVSRFHVLLNQPTYDRRSMAENKSEADTNKMLAEAKQRNAGDRTSGAQLSVDTFRSVRLASLARQLRNMEDVRYSTFSQSAPMPVDSGGPLQSDYLLRTLRHGVGDSDAWSPHSTAADAFQRMTIQRIPELRAYMSGGWSENASIANPNPQDPSVITPPPAPVSPPQVNEYRYRIGLANVAIGVDSPGFKGYFVSKPLDAPGDVGTVRMKTSELNYVLPPGQRDQPQMTSVEYSVSNRSNPRFESDWIPILPADATIVEGERFLPDSTGRGYFRFPASPSGTINLYRNGKSVPLSPELYLQGVGNLHVIGIGLGTGQYGTDDILTVSYTPEGDPTTISFEAAGFTNDLPLVATFDSDGAGEGYPSTFGRNEIDLLHTPYVDARQIATSYYTPLAGHIPYQPISVKLAVGVAINLTNYGSGPQGVLPPAASGYYYLHAGRTLIFNQPVDNFRIFYQYLQNAVRFRGVLRVNDKQFVSPSVDFVHMKAKTRRPNLAER